MDRCIAAKRVLPPPTGATEKNEILPRGHLIQDPAAAKLELFFASFCFLHLIYSVARIFNPFEPYEEPTSYTQDIIDKTCKVLLGIRKD